MSASFKFCLGIYDRACLAAASERLKDQYKKQYCKWTIPVANEKKGFDFIERDREEFTVSLNVVEGKLENEDCRRVCEISQFFERTKGSPSCINNNNLFHMESSRLFLHGIAGIGKTSFVEHLTLLWANEKILNELDFVYLIKCRVLNRYRYKEVTIDKILRDTLGVDFSYVNDLIDGTRVLFIIDGLDELFSLESALRDDTTNSLHSTINSLLHKESAILSGHRCILTGRPHIYPLLRRYEKAIGKMAILEIIGFDRKGIELYIDNFTLRNLRVKKDIIDAIEQNCSLQSMASVPQFLSSICGILATQKVPLDDSHSTELYVWVLVSFVRQHFSELNCMPYKIFGDERFQRFLEKIRRISYVLLLEDKTVFKTGELSELLDTNDKVEQDMLNSFIVKIESATECLYQFKHLSLQEFLAACHCYIECVNIETLLNKKMYGIIEFIAGFACAKKHRSCGQQSILSHFVDCLLRREKESNYKWVLPSVEIIAESLFSRVQERLINWRPLFSIFHELYHENDKLLETNVPRFKCDFVFHSLTSIECTQFTRFMNLILTSLGSDALSEVTIMIMDTVMNGQMSDCLAPLVKHVSKFKCGACQIDCNFLQSLSSSILATNGNNNLAALAFMGCDLTDGEMAFLACCSVHIKRLEVAYTELNEHFCSSLAQSFRSCRERNNEDLKLRDIRLSCCTFLENSVKYLSELIPDLKTLDLSGCELSETQLSEIVDGIMQSSEGRQFPRLETLTLQRCRLQDACVAKLCEVIPYLMYVDISRSATTPGQPEFSSDIMETMIRKIEFAYFSGQLRLKTLIMHCFSTDEEIKRKFLNLRSLKIDVSFRVWKRSASSSSCK